MIDDNLLLEGDALYEARDFERALKAFLEGARCGDTSCMTRAASMYTSGEGIVCCDYDQAIYWERKAADEGDNTALLNLAITYRIRGDLKSFRSWCERAYEAGDGSAAIELAKFYLAADQIVEAKNYLEKALLATPMSENDIKEATQLLSNI